MLLVISVWMRAKLAESPEFARSAKKATIAKAPLREAFGNWKNLKRVLIAFFGIMCAQGAVWYFTFFYMQVFLERSLGLPSQTKDLLLIIMTVVSAPLYVYFGWLSDRIGRKPVMIGGMLLALVLYFPASHWIAGAANPRLVEAQRSTPDLRRDHPGDLLGPVRPGRHRQVRQRLRHRQVDPGHQGHQLYNAPVARWKYLRGGRHRTGADRGGEGLAGTDLKALKTKTADAIAGELQAAGYPKSADPAQANMTLLVIILLVFVVASTALYGPQAAALVEMFPTRIRYTAMSFPYHVGTGWVGGFLPVTTFAHRRHHRQHL